MRALAAVQELRVDVHRELGVRVPYLTLDEWHVEVRRQEHDRDVCAPHGVGCDVRQRRQTVGRELLAGEHGASVEDPFAHVAVVPASSFARAEERRVGLHGIAAADLLRTVGEQYVAELRRDLDVAHTRFGLAVCNP
ncbi:MAG: hypothetical protein ABR992_06655 [Solirubrobacteraceae bacterium]